MKYEIINNLPIDLDFSTKTTKELRLYRDWFLKNKDKRLETLQKAITTTEGFENWEMDYTKKSLKSLGKWFCQNIITEKISALEYEKKREEIPDYIEIDDWDFTIFTRSLFVDIGIYLGEVFIHQYKQLQWEQYITRNKLHADRGQMVICGFNRLCLEPIHIILVIGGRIVNNECSGDEIYKIYNVWGKFLK